MTVIGSVTTHAARRWAPLLGTLASSAILWCNPAAASGVSAVDTPVDSGDLVVVDAHERADAIEHGDADTQFSVRLPAGAACPGDSANDQWRVQTFIIPVAAAPGAIRYGAIGPEPTGNGHYALFEVDTTPFVHGLTLPNSAGGEPGAIPDMPGFSFAVVAGDHIPSGTYRVGVACTHFGVTAELWDIEIVITDPTKNASGEFQWRLASVPAPVGGSQKSSALPATLMISVGGALLLGGLAVWRRRASRRPTFSEVPR